jgi:hypothetical protein
MAKPLRITWINPARIEARQCGFTSHRVDIRLRCIGPAAELVRRGHEVAAVCVFDLPGYVNHPGFFDRDLFVVGKAFADITPMIAQIHKRGGKVVLDICDNMFAPPEDLLKSIYQAILPLADGLVVSSDALGAALADQFRPGVPVATIADFVEGNRLPPAFAPSPDILRLLWFGYPNNLDAVKQSLPGLAVIHSRMNFELSLVTEWPEEARKYFAGDPLGIQTRLVDWSMPALAGELSRCDMVIIPSDDSPARLTKSANRLIASLWAGRYAVAYPLPSYLAFAAYAGVGKDLAGNIMWAVEHPAQVIQRIAAGQEFIASEYANEKIATAWESFLERVRS